MSAGISYNYLDIWGETDRFIRVLCNVGKRKIGEYVSWCSRERTLTGTMRVLNPLQKLILDKKAATRLFAAVEQSSHMAGTVQK